MPGEVILIFGRHDPHIPQDGRLKIYQAFQKSTAYFSWHEFNADHSFMTVSFLFYPLLFSLFMFYFSFHMLKY